MNFLQMAWRLWAKALGEKARKKDHEADKIAYIRTIIFITYLVTNCFIIAGVIRHWNKSPQFTIEIYETQNNSQDLHTNKWNSLGME